MKVQGLSLWLAVDSGFDGMLLYGDRFRKRLPRIRTQGEPTMVSMGRIKAIKELSSPVCISEDAKKSLPS